MESEQKEVSRSLDSEIDVSDFLDRAIHDSSERLDSAKRELAAILRRVVSLRRQLDEMPIQAELIQYERRFSELYAQIQGKLRQTRNYYATYNALIEIKDLMLKEISLLDSISSQFQDAITSTPGRAKLIDSMEAILKGTQQKLDKTQLGLQKEQRKCDDLREKYAAAVMNQSRISDIIKSFQIFTLLSMYDDKRGVKSQTFPRRWGFQGRPVTRKLMLQVELDSKEQLKQVPIFCWTIGTKSLVKINYLYGQTAINTAPETQAIVPTTFNCPSILNKFSISVLHEENPIWNGIQNKSN
ncbi:hypothetical protein V2J09_010188 [Rumex salicifolius]